MTRSLLVLPALVLLVACPRPTAEASAPAVEASEPAPAAAPPVKKLAWSIALHGGAGTIPRDLPAAEKQRYAAGLRGALARGRDVLAGGGTSLEAVEQVIRILEDDPLFNAGKGAVFTATGEHELDASIMDGRDLSCGAVAGVKTVRHPITLARLVKDETRHVLLAGDGADEFGKEQGVERVENGWFATEHRREAWNKKREAKKGTVGVAALDTHGNLAAGTSTGGLTDKKFGRVGDSPIVGAGTYADNRTVAVSCTGIGEEFIRHGIAHSVSQRMALLDESVDEAAKHVIHETLEPGSGGLIAVDKNGRAAFVYNTKGMYRGAADASGRFDVLIWEEPVASAAPSAGAGER